MKIPRKIPRKILEMWKETGTVCRGDECRWDFEIDNNEPYILLGAVFAALLIFSVAAYVLV